MVGSPIYQTCQHVYTAVTRGVRQVIVVNDPENLEAAVKLKPFSRNTKLQQFLTADLKKPSASVSDEAEMDEEDALVSSVNQGSPSPNSASTVGYNSPKTCPKRFSETSAFPTPPQTPPGIQTTPSTSAKQLSNTFPRKSHHPRSTPFRKSGGTPAKGRRRSLKARYDAWCNVCRNPIRAGVDEITHMESASNTSWVHQKCI